MAPKCKVRDVYCQICKNNRHVTSACFTKHELRTTVATAGSAPALRIHASGIDNFSNKIKVLVDTGNLLTIALCVTESFFLSLGGKVGDLLPPSFLKDKGASENSVMHTVGNTIVNIKCSNFNNVILSGPAVVLRNLSQQVIVRMNFLRDNYLNLDLTPDHANLIHTPTQKC